MSSETSSDVIVVGGGIAGLAAAAYAARGGRSVTLFERSEFLGGRAETSERNGFLFNRGPHALYKGGAAEAVLADLGVHHTGNQAPTGGAAIYAGELFRLPGTAGSLLTTHLFGPREKLEAGAVLAGLSHADPAPLDGVTLEDWLAVSIKHRKVREMVASYFRVSSYSNAPGIASAGALIRQFQFARNGVTYLDGGWATLVSGLRDAALASGVRIGNCEPVAAIEREGGVRGVRLFSGRAHEARTVIVAASPTAARDLLYRGEETALQAWAEDAVPVRAACLDVGLSRLPNPEPQFALNIDAPLYFSVHSRSARLAPEGAALISAAKYLPVGESLDAAATERELEALLDLAQPGWRKLLVERQYLPNMTVTNGVVLAARGGLTGRPGPEVPGVPGLFVAGDWVGQEGMLADAALASARAAGKLAASFVQAGLVASATVEA